MFDIGTFSRYITTACDFLSEVRVGCHVGPFRIEVPRISDVVVPQAGIRI